MNIEQLAREAGMRVDYWKMGAASHVFTEGCHGVARDELERFAAAVRREALEEAIQAVLNYDTAQCDTGWGPSQQDLADEIRALQVTLEAGSR